MREEKTKLTDLITLNIKYIFNQKICTALIAFLIMNLSVLVPLFYMLAALLYKDTTGQLSTIYFDADITSTDNQILYGIFVGTVSPFILSFLSILVTFIASAACFVSERQNGTMSLLMLSTSEPIKIYDAKILAVFIFAFMHGGCRTLLGNYISYWLCFYGTARNFYN